MMRKPDLPPSEASAPQEAHRHSADRSSSSQDDWDIEQEDTITPLTRDEARKLFGPKVDRPSRVTPLRVVAVQVALSLFVALIVWLFFGRSMHATLSALLGGAVCWIPSGLFAMWVQRGSASSKMALVAGEALKAGLTLALFVVIGETYPEVRWLPMLAAYVVGLNAYWVALAY